MYVHLKIFLKLEFKYSVLKSISNFFSYTTAD